MSHDIFSAFTSEELQSALSSKLFRGMLDTMPIAVAVLDAECDGRGNISHFSYRFANKTAERMAGSPLQGKRLFLNDDALLFNTMSDVVATGNREDFLYHFQGEPEKWIHYSISRFGLGVMLTYENVTERKKAALALQRERTQMAEAQAISSTGSFEWDLVAKKVYWSDEMYRIHSLEPQLQEIDPESVCGFIHPDDLIRIRKKIENYSKIPGHEEMLYKLKLPNGQIRHIRTRLESFRGKSGRITHISGMAQDVTERKQTEEELRNVSDLLRKQSAGNGKREATLEDFGRIIGSVHDAIISIDTKGYIVTWNAGAERIYGYTPGEAIGRHLGRLIVPDDQQDALMERLTKVLKNGESIVELVTTKKCKDKSLIEVTSNIVPLKDAFGKITGAAATSKNISEIRKANQQLKKMNELLDLKNTIHSKAEITGNLGTWDWNSTTGKAHYSDNMFRLLGMQPGEVEPSFETIDPLINSDDKEKLKDLMLTLQKNPTETATVDYRVIRKDGEHRIFCNRVSITKDSEGQEVYIGITEDVTERRNAEAEITRLRDEVSQTTEDKYRTLFQAIDEGFALYELKRDENGNVVDMVYHEVNEAYERITGIQNVVGRAASELVPNLEPSWFERNRRIADTGIAERNEDYIGDLDRWFSVHYSRVGGQGSNLIIAVFDDITQRKNTEREQTLLLRLSDIIRAHPTDTAALQQLSMQLLAEQFKVMRSVYYEAEPDEDTFTLTAKFEIEAVPIPTQLRLSDFSPTVAEEYRTGRTQLVSDTENEPSFEAYREIGVRAWLGVPLIKNKKLVTVIGLHSKMPRTWTNAEVRLLELFTGTVYSAVEKARAEEALRESENLLSRTFDLLPIGIGVLDKDGVMQRLNPQMEFHLPNSIIPSREPARAARWRGWDSEGKLVEPQNFPSARALRGEKAPGIEMLFEDDDGQKQWTQVSSLPLQDENGTVTGAISIVININNLKVSEEALRKSEEKYRTLFETIDEGFCVIELIRDKKGKAVDFIYREVNESFERLTGFENPVGKRISELVSDVEKYWIEAYAKVVDTGEPLRMENYLSGVGRWYSVQGSRVGEKKDNLAAVVFNDITQLKHSKEKAEHQISEQNKIIQSMTTATPDIMFVMDINTKKVLFATRNIAEDVGYTKEQIAEMKEPFLDIMHPEDRPAMIKHIKQMKTAFDGEVREIQYRIIHADGSIHWFVDRSTVFRRDEKGVPYEKMGITHDIHSRVDADEKIQMLNTSLSHKNRELRLLHNDLKTLTSVAAYDYKETLQTLYTNLEFVISRDAQNFSNPGKANLRKAQTAIQKMKLLTDDIVAFTKIKAPDESPSAVDLGEVIGTVLDELSEKMTEASPDIKLDKLPVINGYPYLIELMFYHLIDNAIKFRNPDKKLEISITRHTSNDKHTGQPVYQISISDNGIGFEQQYASKIFEMFYRIHDKKYKGSGIGLPICKKIADLHGGTMAIESQPGQGTLVCCFFPMT